ncbi:hypothetical protein KVS17_02385 [Helicobacter pylori]|nr:hypothetical protein KVS17_02385 [Helicobacter pylori]
MRTSCARYECMEILYHELVAFIPNAKDDWDFCFGWLNINSNAIGLDILREFKNEMLSKEFILI